MKHLKALFNVFLNEFYSLAAFSLNQREANAADPQQQQQQQLQQLQQGTLDFDKLALHAHAAAPSQMKFVFFGVPAALQRRRNLTALVKRLVELEGHLI